MARGKIRLDRLLLERGLAEDLSKAQSLILSGSVLVNDQVVDKVGLLFAEDSSVRLKEVIPKYVSRGAFKLKKAFELWNIDLSDKLCLDWGASTGGFTQVLLEQGAKNIFAFDVGYGQMVSRIAKDPRVKVIDRFHVKNITWDILEELWKSAESSDFPEKIFLVMDLSFISLRNVFPIVKRLHDQVPGRSWSGFSLIKPQFEVDPKFLTKGILTDPKIRLRTVRSLLRFARKESGIKLLSLSESPIAGADGNQEILMYWSI
ncbi:TlyA family rRNA (cytidine-2'-O)-methyltransferase [Leptospira perolatii]|uniref:TlyA family rRNA (Cytidine-2'-O)-methyltransferase n=1 Tax=Leptospira perolatii TaxID=2023191 RepID=A0A2M9ZI30_9LEPT|nr:TlyA family RNA methyltransferase [Leptospira perolatii]PJZ68098.1 TlyA family rRNA (cytidine-2'-O)-methyltransferase [Leptospira perolatii]PJZ71717.1 TlyA family rRNA (cytidine-2'-O)-methyltransferase [Leptospira perolatii]